MKLLFVGDSHGDQSFISHLYRDVLSNLRSDGHTDIEYMVSVGDFGLYSDRSGEAFLKHVNYWAERTNVKMMVVPGNHDDYDLIDSLDFKDGIAQLRENIFVADRGAFWNVGNRNLLLVSGARSPDGPGGIFEQVRGPIRRVVRTFDKTQKKVVHREELVDLGWWWPREEITFEETQDIITSLESFPGKIDVLVSHEAPSAFNIPYSGVYKDGDAVRNRLQLIVDKAHPRLLFCGHWHMFRKQRLISTDTQAYILSANVNPSEPFWALLDLTDLAVKTLKPPSYED